jgi:hypothetical protein
LSLQEEDATFNKVHTDLANIMRGKVITPMCGFVLQASPYMPQADLPDYPATKSPLINDNLWQQVSPYL